MAIGHYKSVNGIARKVTKAYDSVDGIARNRIKAYDGVDGVARLFFAPDNGAPVILEVEKITADTYANDTTYTAEEFILLDIYPKAGGTVSVTYGGLTKTITDTSGAEEPNAQEVFFGTFNGVTDSVATPTSGELTIEGDYYAFSCSSFSVSDKQISFYFAITEIKSFGSISKLVYSAFGDKLYAAGCSFTYADIPDTVITIDGRAFNNCTQLEWVNIPSSVKTIGENPFYASNPSCAVIVHEGNQNYKMDGNCLVEVDTNTVISGLDNCVIPSYITAVKSNAFVTNATTMVIPSKVNEIGIYALANCANMTSITFENPIGWSVYSKSDMSDIVEVDVSDPATNVTLFRDTYAGYNFVRS